jgi:PAS domain S-box-containing protein
MNEANPMSKSAGEKILIAGNDESARQALAQSLTLMEYTVLTTVDGKQALQVYERERPDIVFVDAQMPYIDGFGVLDTIREKTTETEVIIITERSDMDTGVKALHAGASDFISKPVDQTTLDIVLQRTQERLQLKRELHATQKALRISEAQRWEDHEQLTATLNALPDLLFEVDRHGRIYDFRAPRPELLYVPPDKFLGQTMAQVLPKETANAIIDALEQAVEKGRHTGAIYPLETAAGANWFELSVATKGDPKTPNGRLVMLVRDITERKQAEEALQKAHDELEIRVAERTTELGKAIEELHIEIAERKRVEEALRTQQNLLKTIFNASPDLLVLKDRNSVYQAVNTAFCHSVGKLEEEIVNKTDLDIFSKSEAERRRRDDAQVMGSGMPQVCDEQVGGEEIMRWMQVVKTPVFDETGTCVGILCSSHDITERKLAEWALDERVKEMTCLYTIHRDMQEGLPLDKLCWRVIEHLSVAMQYPEMAAPVIELYGIQFASDNYTERLPQRLYTTIKVSSETCGHLAIYSTETHPFLIPEEQNLLNAVAEALGLWLERKQAEEALRKSERKLRAQYQSIPVPTYTWQKVWDDIVLTDYNDAATAATQGKIANFVGIKAKEMYHDIPEVLEELSWCFAERSTLEREMFYQLKTTGESKHFAVKYAFVPPDQVSVYTEDITERKRMEQYLLRSERLAAMGHMAATVAHEIQNPLQAIQSHLELVLDFDLEPNEKKEYLRFCCQEIERLTGITERVLGFARPSKDTLRPTTVTHLMQRALAISKPLQHARIQVTNDIPVNLPPVLVIPDQIVQVLLNLIINAIEAIPDTGHVHVTAYIDQDREDKDMVVLTLTNDGPPIPPEQIEHIFDPFFTTKPGGTGLGLFTSHNIIEQHGGMISVENLSDDQGVVFGIALPIARQAEEQEIAA